MSSDYVILGQFPAATGVADGDMIYAADVTTGDEKRVSAAQIGAYVQAPIANGTLADAGTLSGAEVIPVGRSGLLQTTLDKIASFALEAITLGSSPGVGALTGPETFPVGSGGGLEQATSNDIKTFVLSTITQGTSPAAATLTGAEEVPLSQGSALAQATLSSIGTYALSPIAKSKLTLATALTGTETIPISQSASLFQTTLTGIANWIANTYASFTQTATAAVARSIISKLGDGALTPEDFGALGNGTADDTLALQAWLNALTAGKMGKLSPGKTYGFTNLTLPNPTPYAGTSHDPSRTFGLVIDGQNSILKKIAAGTDPAYGIASTLWLSNSASTSSPVYFTNLNIDLNGLATTAGLITQHWNSLFERVNVFNAAGHGFMQSGASRNGTYVTGGMNNNNWTACDFYSNGGHGLYVYAPNSTNNTDGILDRVRAFDNALANVNITVCAGWDFVNLHCWNYIVTQTDIAITRFAICTATKWRGCEFDVDSNNPATPACDVLNGSGSSMPGVFSTCYFYSPLSLRNSNATRVGYALTGCQFRSTAYVYLNGTAIEVVSSASVYQSIYPFQSLVNDGTNTAASAFDYWTYQGVQMNGQHLLTKGTTAPYIGGYAYRPVKSHAYNLAASGATYAIKYADSLWQIFSTALTAAITIQLPPKANMSDGQPPFVFHRQATATGAFNILIVDVDTGSTIATMTTAGTYQNILFDGTAWRTAGSGSL